MFQLSAVVRAVHFRCKVVICRRNRFQGTGSKVPEPVPKPGTRNRSLNTVSLTHCIICVLYESLFVNNESRDIGLKLICVLVFTFSFIHSFINSLHLSAAKYEENVGLPYSVQAARISSTSMNLRKRKSGTRFLDRVISQLTSVKPAKMG